MIYLREKLKGFSLLEVLLVLAIMATIMVSLLGYTSQKSDEMRRDKTVMQVEQFLNAGLSYYVSFGSWPTLSQLQGNFLPSGTINNPWGLAFSVGANTGGTNPGSQFSVCTTIRGKQAYTAATIIAGRLPIASAIDGTVSCPTTSATACTKTSTTCTVVSSVNIPGQNINNARSINFAGLYHNGACVAAPSCPSTTMTPTIVVSPVSVSGMNDNNNNVYPITSFTAYAMGTTSAGSPGAAPLNCNGTSTVTCSLSASSTYWRVCLRIVTQKGMVTGGGNPSWAQTAGVILALTRCMPANEPSTPEISGSSFTVFTSD